MIELLDCPVCGKQPTLYGDVSVGVPVFGCKETCFFIEDVIELTFCGDYEEFDMMFEPATDEESAIKAWNAKVKFFEEF